MKDLKIGYIIYSPLEDKYYESDGCFVDNKIENACIFKTRKDAKEILNDFDDCDKRHFSIKKIEYIFKIIR